MSIDLWAGRARMSLVLNKTVRKCLSYPRGIEIMYLFVQLSKLTFCQMDCQAKYVWLSLELWKYVVCLFGNCANVAKAFFEVKKRLLNALRTQVPKLGPEIVLFFFFFFFDKNIVAVLHSLFSTYLLSAYLLPVCKA